MNYTKGEWKANCLGSEGYDIRPVYKDAKECKENGLFLQICPRVWGKTWDEGKANAHLIAAAPEMYEVLKEAKERYGNYDPFWSIKVREILVKAEGK